MRDKDGPTGALRTPEASSFPIGIIALCLFLNAIDGFDVLAISLAAPGISAEWGISGAELGIVLSMELVGMAFGSVILGALADTIGRRPVILWSLAVMASGMFLASLANGVLELSALRLATGVAIGGVLAATNAIGAEYMSHKRRGLGVTIMAAGYPIGVTIGSAVGAFILALGGWRTVFEFGAVVTALAIPLVWIFLPESMEFLAQRRPKGALEKINRTLRRLNRAPLAQLPAVATPQNANRRVGALRLFAPNLAMTTTLLTIAYCGHLLAFYFMLKWVPTIVADMGFSQAAAGGVLAGASASGLAGTFLLALLTQRFGSRVLVALAMFASGASLIAFGSVRADIEQLSIFAAIVGLFANASIVGLYAIFALAFPTEMRAGGTGFVIGVGRGAAALGPVAAGLMFSLGLGLQGVAIVMALGSIAAGVAIMSIRVGRPAEPA